MTTKIDSYILPDKIIQKMKDTIKESDKLGKNLCFPLLKTEKGELSAHEMPANLPSLGVYMYCKPHTGQVILRKGHIDRSCDINVEDIVGYFITQANEKEPIPDLTDLHDMCRKSYYFHCRGANNKISCYKRKPDATLDCKDIEEEKKTVKDIIKDHFDKIDIV